MMTKRNKLILLGLTSFVLILNLRSLDNRWSYTQYLFDYQFGFIKRGFIGEVFRQFEFPRDFSSIGYLGISFAVIFTVISFFYFFNKGKNNFYFAALALSSSATVQHFVYDRIRFDIIIYLLAFICLFINQKRFSSFFVTLILILCLFIHEATIFFLCPLLLFLNFNQYKSKPLLIAQSLIILVITFFIGSYGAIKGISYEEHYAFLKERFPQTSEGSVYVLHLTGLIDNISNTLVESFTKRRLFHHIYLFLYLIPYFLILRKLWKTSLTTTPIKIALILSLSPLALYPIAVDHFRWWSLALTNIMLSLGYFIRIDEQFRISFDEFIHQHKRLFKTLIFLSFALGPIKITTCFY